MLFKHRYDPKHATRFTTKNAPIVEFHGSVDTTIPISHALRVQAEYNKTGVYVDIRSLFVFCVLGNAPTQPIANNGHRRTSHGSAATIAQRQS